MEKLVSLVNTNFCRILILEGTFIRHKIIIGQRILTVKG